MYLRFLVLCVNKTVLVVMKSRKKKQKRYENHSFQ